jgi:aspartyl protease family protein
MKRILRVAVAVATVWMAIPILMRAEAPMQSGAAETQLRLGALLAAEGRYVEALDAYARLLMVNDAAVLVRARKGVARMALRTGSYELAAEQADLLTRALPLDPEALSIYGDAMWATGLFSEAEAAYRESASLDPRHARARRGVARSLAGKSRLAEAMSEGLMAEALAPADEEIHQTLGYIYERMRRYQDAAREFSAVLGLLPVKDFGVQAAMLQSQVAYLRSFGNKTPYQIRQPGRARFLAIPFREEQGKVVIQARVNGHATDLVVDTGAEQTVLSRQSAQRLGVMPLVTTFSAGVGEIGLRGVEIGTIDSLEIGSLRVDNVPCLVKNPPLTDMPSREQDSMSPPALGLSMSIDYGRRVLTMGTALPEEPADFELPLYLNRLVTVRGLVDNSRAANFIVDTGGQVISISSAVANSLTRPPSGRLIPLKIYGVSGWDRSAYLRPGVDLAFDDIRYTNFSVVVLDLDAPSLLLGYQLGGIVGRTFLRNYRVDIDLEWSVLRLKRAQSPAAGH